MGRRREKKGVIKSLFNFRAWSDFDRIADQSRKLADSVDDVFHPSSEGRKEDFEQAKRRLNLTEQDIEHRKSIFFRLAILMMILFFPVLGYALNLFMQGHWHSGILGVVVSMIPLVLAFRYHFWYYQLKQRKLGISFQEWLHHGLLGEKR